MSLDVRSYEPGERGKEIRRAIFWPIIILFVGVLTFLVIKIGPRWFDYDKHLENQAVMVRVYDAPEVKSQVIAGVGDKKVAAPVPDLKIKHPDGSTDISLDKIVDRSDGKLYANHRVTVQNAQILRVLGDDVIGVGDPSGHEILVHIPSDAKPANDSQLDPKARVNVTGMLMPMPPLDRAKALLRLGNISTEAKPLPPVYVEASNIRLVESKPMYGDND